MNSEQIAMLRKAFEGLESDKIESCDDYIDYQDILDRIEKGELTQQDVRMLKEWGIYEKVRKILSENDCKIKLRKTYYRPIWTCGKYNSDSQAAIFYNLITGMSYYFEDYSAMVIGEILSVQRNGKIQLNTISEKLNISLDSLEPFFNELADLGIVSHIIPTDETITNYRNHVCNFNKEFTNNTPKETKEKLPYAISNAEQLYTQKVGGITSVMLEMTYKCSEKCIHCYNIGATRNDEEISLRGDRDELSLDDYKKLIDDLIQLGLIKVCLSGGDPFSNPLTWDIIQYLYNKDIAFDVFTNGQAIIKDTKKLADYYPRLVGISIYSGLAEVHDYITRIKGSWERSIKVAKELSQLAVPLNLKCCVMRPNIKSYQMVADIAKRIGAEAQFEVCITDSIEGDKCASKYLRLTDAEYEIVLRDDNIPLYVGKEAPDYGCMTRDMESSPCGAGEHSLCVTPEGNIIPCCSFHDIYGNIRENHIGDIISTSENRKQWISKPLKSYEDCGQHDYCPYCNLCVGNNFIEHGDYTKAAEFNCHIAKIRCNLAIKMQEGYDPLNGLTVQEKLEALPDYKHINLRREFRTK